LKVYIIPFFEEKFKAIINFFSNTDLRKMERWVNGGLGGWCVGEMGCWGIGVFGIVILNGCMDA
jgi:hypothetical protein